ncbi:hypothetical protein BKA69DRAFT_1043002 [Paraphysoderma sedebokerense]|nr:hypothetical protein BKA69DRAFT_1043002 [Paraphysoderma sedebokerense]
MLWVQEFANRDWDNLKLNEFTNFVLSEVQVGSNPVSSSTSISSSLKQSGANNDTATSRTLRIGATIDSKTEKLKYTSLKPIHPFLCALRLSLIAFVIGNYQVILLLLFTFAATYSIFTKYRKRRLHNIIVEQLTKSNRTVD